MPWISPYSIVLGVALVAASILIGRIRRHSRSVIALNTVGVLLYFGSVAWVSVLGPEAFAALAMGSLGAILFTMGSERSGKSAAG